MTDARVLIPTILTALLSGKTAMIPVLQLENVRLGLDQALHQIFIEKNLFVVLLAHGFALENKLFVFLFQCLNALSHVLYTVFELERVVIPIVVVIIGILLHRFEIQLGNLRVLLLLLLLLLLLVVLLTTDSAVVIEHDELVEVQLVDRGHLDFEIRLSSLQLNLLFLLLLRTFILVLRHSEARNGALFCFKFALFLRTFIRYVSRSRVLLMDLLRLRVSGRDSWCCRNHGSCMIIMALHHLSFSLGGVCPAQGQLLPQASDLNLGHFELTLKVHHLCVGVDVPNLHKLLVDNNLRLI